MGVKKKKSNKLIMTNAAHGARDTLFTHNLSVIVESILRYARYIRETVYAVCVPCEFNYCKQLVNIETRNITWYNNVSGVLEQM